MIEEFYGFSGKPFQLTPDPEFYFPSLTHRKALSYLGYGLAQGEGFIVITGEIGAGKSTLVAHVIATLDRNEASIAQIVTSALDGEAIVHVVAQAFGLAVSGHDKASALGAIEAFLHAEARAGRRSLLVVDEAQNLSVTALEELRMLSNFQLGNHPLLQILLLGQPEFRATLQQDHRLEQLRQRVIASHHLEAMQPAEIEPYVSHRLARVGWAGNPAFDQRVYAEIHAASGGIPRKINQIANRLLLLGAVEQRSRIDAAMLRQVLAEMGGEVAFSSPLPNPPGSEALAMPLSGPAGEKMPDVEKRPAGGGLAPSEVEGSSEAALAQGAPVSQGGDSGWLDPQLVEDLLAERDVQIAELRAAIGELASRASTHEPQDRAQSAASASEPDPAIARLADAIARIRRDLAELQQAVIELADQGEQAAQQALHPELEALREELSRLELRTFEQERTIRQTLTMLIEWIESEMDESRAA